MATPAATLQILVEANTAGATTTLRKFNSALQRTDKTSVSATTRTRALGSASRTAGSHLASAAKYAASAAVAYLSISQAKAAVTTTQDLAKATLGLQKNLGLSGRAAGEWAAAAQSRGVDTTKLGMAFKTLSTQVEAAKTGSATAAQLFKDLGVSMSDVKKGSTDVQGLMLKIADGMDAAGAGTQRTADAGKLFGRSWAGLAPLIRDGSAALKDNLATTEKYGAALHGQTLKDQEKLRGLLIESKTAWLGVQVSLTQFLTPALDVANKQFQKLSTILADDKLTNAEKFKKVGDLIGKWADKALDAFVAVLPQIVSKAGTAAPKIAGALVKGFLDAPILGKLALGGWLLAKFGGLRSISVVGGMLGARLGTSMAAGVPMAGFTMVGAEGGAALGAALKSAALPFVGDLIAAFAGVKFALSDTGKGFLSQGTTKDVSDLAEQFGITTKKAEALDRFLAKNPDLNFVDKMGEGIKNLEHDLVARYGTLTRAGADMSKGQRESFEKVALAARQNGEITAAQLKRIDDAMSNSRHKWEQNVRAVAQVTGETTRQIKAAVGDMSVKVSKSYDNMVEITGSGLQILTRNTSKAMAALGLKQELKWQLESRHGGLQPQAQQTGGIIVPGQGSGDKVPAMLEPGEVVINRKAVAAMGGAHRANAVNSMIPRFQSGGVVGKEILSGPDGALRSIGQAALDKVWSAAEDFLSSKKAKAPSTGGGLGPSVAIGPIQEMAKAMVTKIWGGSQWSPFNALEMSEAGWNPRAVNPSSGAAGLAQALPPSKYPPGAWPYQGLDSARLQLQWMTGYIKDRYGSPSSAWAFHQANNWYAKGGIAGQPAGAPALTDEMALKLAMARGIPDAFASGGVAKGSSGGVLGRMIDEASRINALHSTYLYGGGHSTPAPSTPPWDCSSAVSRVLQTAGYDIPTMVSGALANWGSSGTGPATIFANSAHTFMKLGGRYWGTSHANRGGGPGWVPASTYSPSYLASFAKRVPPGNVTTGGSGGSGSSGSSGGSSGGSGGSGSSGPEPTGTIGGAGGSGSGISKNLQGLLKLIGTLRGKTTILGEKISTAQTLDAMLSSPAGSELSDAERYKEVILGNDLLSNLLFRVTNIKKAIPMLLKGDKRKGTLKGELETLQGITGGAGLILDARVALDALGVSPLDVTPTDTAGSTEQLALLKAMLVESQQRYNVSQSQYKVLADLPYGGGFATGGVVPGPVGAPVMVTAHGGETITPVGQAANVTINVAPGMEWLKQFITVQVDGQTRKQARGRPLGGARGH